MRPGQFDQLDTRAETQYLTFTLGEVNYALPILKVREIVPLAGIRTIPRTPPHVRGVMDVRGLIIPIIDLRARLGLERSEATRCSVVVVVKLAWELAGFVVDGVTDILRLGGHEIERTDEVLATVEQRFVHGVAKSDGRLVLVLDPEHLAGYE